ncbi:MAG: hypothetical protein Q9216_002365 [Gyalolechia sp. 2 TL-2023]
MHPYVAIPATVALVWRAYSRKSLTPAGIVTAALTAIVHAIHPWSVFFAMLVVFFLAGTSVTKVKHHVKASLTLSSSGSSGGEGTRTHIQVLANSFVASVLILLHYRQLLARDKKDDASQECWPYGEDLPVVGIISNYAAVAADTFSSELGILSKSRPRLLTSWNLRQVPPGTNGGITLWGTVAGFLGASTIALTSVLLLPFCSVGSTSKAGKLIGDNQLGLENGSGWALREKVALAFAITIWGGMGSLVDSAFGGWLQASVIDSKTGKVIEGNGGAKVPLIASHIKKDDNGGSRRVESGAGLLDNNAVNILMAMTMSLGGITFFTFIKTTCKSKLAALHSSSQLARHFRTFTLSMAPFLKQSTVAGIRRAIDEATANKNRIPGCVFMAVNKNGKTLIDHASGDRGLDTRAPMTLDSVFWIASCTKMICGIAAMQLVEQGQLRLDDADHLEEICPELKKIRILKNVDEYGKPELIDKKNRMTLRMLLTHTVPALTVAETRQVGIDWAGRAIERASGMTLSGYMQKSIFQPLGLKSFCFFPTAEMKNDLVHMHHREPDGNLRERDHLYRRPLLVDDDDISKVHNSGGHGCFARPAEFCDILSTLLNSGTSPKTSARILSSTSVTEMFTNQIPQFPNFGRRGIAVVKPDLANPMSDLYPQPLEQPQGWGITFMLTIHEGATGRGRNTAMWAGLPNLFWWCDREKGVAGMIAAQILPFADAEVMDLWTKLEVMIYADLEEGKGRVSAKMRHPPL